MSAAEKLTAEQVLDRSLVQLRTLWPNKEITLDPPLRIEMADDSDPERAAKGFFSYPVLFELILPTHRWVIGRGKRTGSYPDSDETGDLIACLLPSNVTADRPAYVARLLCLGDYFAHSVVVTRRGGEFCAGGSQKRQSEFHRHFHAEADEVIAQESVANTEVMSWSLTPVYDQDTLWTPRTVELMAEAIAQALLLEDRESPVRS